MTAINPGFQPGSTDEGFRLTDIGQLLLAVVFLAVAGQAPAQAPDFTLPATKGDKFSLSSFAGKKNVIIQFYVLDFTPT